MRTLAPAEKRTIQIGAAIVAVVLALSGGAQLWKRLTARRVEYNRLVQEARKLRAEVKVYQQKAQDTKMLMETFHLDPARLTKASVVAEASAAIQKAAAGGGVGVGPIRESPGRPSAAELASMQLDCSGPVPAMMTLLSRFESLGYPLILDSVQITPEPRPGMVKMHLTIIILDFEQWKEEKPNA